MNFCHFVLFNKKASTSIFETLEYLNFKKNPHFYAF